MLTLLLIFAKSREDFIKANRYNYILWGTISHQSEWLLFKSLQAINAEEGVEEREPSYTVGGNVNWYSHYGKQYGGILKTKNTATIWSSNPTPGHISEKEKN